MAETINIKEEILNIIEEDKDIEKDVVEFSEEHVKKILGNKLKELMENKNKNYLSELVTDINRLKQLMTEAENFEGSIQWWRMHTHISGKKTRDIANDEDLNEAFKLVNKISSFLRGEEEIILRVIVTNNSGKTEVFEIPEDLVKTKVVRSEYTDKEGKNHKINEIQYLLSSVKQQGKKMEVSKAFEEHFDYFTQVAERLKKQNSERYSGMNKGHIAEAFYSHFNFVHDESDYTNETLFDQTSLTGREVGPALYAAMNNNIGWWAAGDVENIQIKTSKNLRLASIQSIKILANELVSLFEGNTFDWHHFEEVYTERGQLKVQEEVKESYKQKRNKT